MEQQITFTIPASGASSVAAGSVPLTDCGEWTLAALYFPATYPGSLATLYGWYSQVPASAGAPVYNSAGSPATYSVVAGSPRVANVAPADAFSLPRYLMIVSPASGASAASVVAVFRP